MDTAALRAALMAPVEAFSEKFHLPTLPLHVHQVVLGYLAYDGIFRIVSPWLSRKLLPQTYANFNRRTRINWDVHVVSFVQAVYICGLALWGMHTDKERATWNTDDTMGKLQRVHGYTPIGGAVQGYAAGYFVWDLLISGYYIDIFGIGFVAHAFAALAVFGLGFRPFVNYYAPVFILFELSSPFLNIHWFCDKVGLTGSMTQLVNGIFLITSFFCCRLLWGTYQSVQVFSDVFHLYFNPPPETHPSVSDLVHTDPMTEGEIVPHPFAGKKVDLWMAVVYLGSNLVLNGLNYFWFVRMIQTVTARFTKKDDAGKKEKQIVKADDGNEEDKVWIEGMDMDIGRATDAAMREAGELRKRMSFSSPAPPPAAN